MNAGKYITHRLSIGELVQYLISLFSFHSALYCMRSFSLLLKLVETKKYRCTKCKGIKQDTLHVLVECDHHPDIFLGYKKVTVKYSTHTAGGVTGLDFKMAGIVDNLAKSAKV